MRTSLLRTALLAGGCSLLAACGSPTAPSSASVRTDQGHFSRAPESVTITPGSGAVLDGGGLNDGVAPPEVTINGVPVNNRAANAINTECPGNVVFHANDSVTITQGQGAALNDGSATDGCPRPEISIIRRDGTTWVPGSGGSPR